MHNILTLQNRPENIRLLAAQRQLYQKAKEWFVLQVLLTVPATIILSLLKLVPEERIANLFVYTGVTLSGMIAIADLLIAHFFVSKSRTQAAKIQEQFDCNVFEMEWDSISVGSKIEQEIINKFAGRYKPISESPLPNWYPEEITNFSKADAIYTCQKTNVHYDRTLRNQYLTTVCLISMGIFLVIFLTSLISGSSLNTFVFQIIIPFIPVLILTIKIIQEHTKLIKESNELHKSMTALEQNKARINMQELRTIQTKIYNNRKTGALVPDFFYNLKRRKLEAQMHMNAANDKI